MKLSHVTFVIAGLMSAVAMAQDGAPQPLQQAAVMAPPPTMPAGTGAVAQFGTGVHLPAHHATRASIVRRDPRRSGKAGRRQRKHNRKGGKGGKRGRRGRRQRKDKKRGKGGPPPEAAAAPPAGAEAPPAEAGGAPPAEAAAAAAPEMPAGAA